MDTQTYTIELSIKFLDEEHSIDRVLRLVSEAVQNGAEVEALFTLKTNKMYLHEIEIARSRGDAEGYARGLDDGRVEGRVEGFDEGFTVGFRQGRDYKCASRKVL